MSGILRNASNHLLPRIIHTAKFQPELEKRLIKNFQRRSHSVLSSAPCILKLNIFTYQRCFHIQTQMLQVKKGKEQTDVIRAKEKNESSLNPYAGLSRGETVKEATKDASYLGVIIVGVGIFGYIFYALFSELFSKSSPSSLYSYAYKQCKLNTQIKDIFGEPLKGYGETTRRGRRRHVSHIEFMEDGVKTMRMQFYIEGPLKKGTVTLEAKQNESGKYEIQFIYVEVNGLPPRVIVVEDNSGR